MNLTRCACALVVLAGLVGFAAPAFAQDTAEASDVPTMQEEIDAIWAERRSVRVLQRRLYSTEGEVQATVFFGAIPNDPFLTYFPIGVRFGYWLGESLALELSGEYTNLTATSDLNDFLADRVNADSYLRDQQQWRVNLAALYSPIYGKFSLAGRKLAHFDWYFGVGVGAVQTESADPNDLTTQLSELKPEAVLITGWNIHLHQRWALRLDYRQGIFEKASGGVTLPSEISLGASFFF